MDRNIDLCKIKELQLSFDGHHVDTFGNILMKLIYLVCYPLANEVVKGYSNAIVRPSVTSL
jgi:hypothetical protein